MKYTDVPLDLDEAVILVAAIEQLRAKSYVASEVNLFDQATLLLHKLEAAAERLRDD